MVKKIAIKEKLVKRVVSLYVFILLVWGFYRFLFRFPEEIEELVFKPIIWLLPTLFLVWRQKKGLASLGWRTKNFFKSVWLGLFLGVLFALEGLLTHALKYQGFSFVKPFFSPELFFFSFLLSLATAITEETVFRGYIFNRLWQILGNEWLANFASSLGWGLVHLPVTIFVFGFSPLQVLAFLVLNFAFGVGSSFAFARTGNLISCVLIHVFWGWPIILFR